MDKNIKSFEMEYKTLESETIVLFSTIYAVLSIVLVGMVFRFWLSDSYKFCVISFYAIFSIFFLAYIGVQSRRRTKLNKLPSGDVLNLCYLVKESGCHGVGGFGGGWNITRESFNRHSMVRLFSDGIARIIPHHDYFSYMIAERFIEVSSVTDSGSDVNKNTLSIRLSDKAVSRLKIFEESDFW